MAALAGKRILVVEDEYFIASDVRRALDTAGAQIIGPVGDLESALRFVSSNQIDMALIDVNLSGVKSYPLVDALLDQSVPFLFLTGYDEWALPQDYRAFPRLSKPTSAEHVLEALSMLPVQ